MKKDYKLTISIMASNRKETMQKCLESIKPILDNVSSELIVTDTGCDEDLLEIIRTYTDKIIKFTWCNDFAKARNVGLNLALGEWFMYVDDDEWFDNVEEFIEFFNSKEADDYNYGRYITRDYVTIQGDKWSDCIAGRIFKLDEDLRFEGRIHEFVRKKDAKIKNFSVYTHHYGYAYKNREELMAHSERNIKILEEQIRYEPAMARYYAHLYQTCRATGDYEKSWEYTLKALQCVDTDDNGNLKEMCSTYVNYIYLLIVKEEYDEAIRIGNDFIYHKKLSQLARAALYSYVAIAYVKCGKYTDCLKVADQYLKAKEYYNDRKNQFYGELAPMLKDTFADAGIERTLGAAIKSAVELHSINKAYQYILELDWSKNITIIDEDSIQKLADLTVQCDDTDTSVRVFGKIFTDLRYSNILLKRIMETKKQSDSAYLKLCDVMSRISGQAGYKLLVDIIAAEKADDIEQLNRLYASVSENDMSSMEKEISLVALRRNISIKV